MRTIVDYYDGKMEMLVKLYGKENVLSFNYLPAVVKHFKWAKKITRDYEEEIRKQYYSNQYYILDKLKSDDWERALIGQKCDTEWVIEWLEKYESGKWIVIGESDMNEDGGYDIIKSGG